MIRVENPGRTQLESQDDLAYLTGRRSADEAERQVRYGPRSVSTAGVLRDLEPEEPREDI